MHPNDQTIVTCVYCGHEYPEGTPTSQHELLTEHIKVCKKHPMKGALDDHCREREARQKAEGQLEECRETLGQWRIEAARLQGELTDHVVKLAITEKALLTEEPWRKKAEAENQKLRELLENILDAVPAMYREQYEQIIK